MLENNRKIDCYGLAAVQESALVLNYVDGALYLVHSDMQSARFCCPNRYSDRGSAPCTKNKAHFMLENNRKIDCYGLAAVQVSALVFNYVAGALYLVHSDMQSARFCCPNRYSGRGRTPCTRKRHILS
jgi:hypothetical protein